jgi:drug/metabolite transporter (DMT)-like permease
MNEGANAAVLRAALSDSPPLALIARTKESLDRGRGANVMATLIVWGLTICSVGFFILCDSLSTNWAKHSSVTSLFAVIVLSPVAYIFFGLVSSRANLAVGGAMVNLILVLAAVLVGLFYFKEKLSMLQWTGIGFGLIAILILSLSVQK